MKINKKIFPLSNNEILQKKSVVYEFCPIPRKIGEKGV